MNAPLVQELQIPAAAEEFPRAVYAKDVLLEEMHQRIQEEEGEILEEDEMIETFDSMLPIYVVIFTSLGIGLFAYSQKKR